MGGGYGMTSAPTCARLGTTARANAPAGEYVSTSLHAGSPSSHGCAPTPSALHVHHNHNSSSCVYRVRTRTPILSCSHHHSRQPALRSGFSPAVPPVATVVALQQSCFGSHASIYCSRSPVIPARQRSTLSVRGCTCERVSVCICV